VFRDLLVHVDGSQAGRQRVKFAIDLAERTGARLDGLHVTPPAEAPPRQKPSTLARVQRALEAELAADALAAEAIFRDETAKLLSGARWFQAAGDMAANVNARARCADLVVLGQYEWQDPPHRHPLPVANFVAMQCGRPVLVVPAGAPTTQPNRVAIAWDGGREVVRAVHDALPLLRLARTIDIMTIAGSPAAHHAGDGEELATHLAHHEVNASISQRRVVTRDDHGSLRKEVEAGRYDLLVMGGYSHPMWMEFVFGGATHSILLSSKTPVLVSH